MSSGRWAGLASGGGRYALAVLRDPVQWPEFAPVVGEGTLPANLSRRRLRLRRLAVGRVAFIRQLRGLALAALVGLTAGVAAGCGSSAPPATGPFLSCSASGVEVPGGHLEVLSVDGAPCQAAELVISAVIVDLYDGKATAGGPRSVEGWNCVTYVGSQATCIHGRATIYAQYLLSKRHSRT